MQQRELRQVRRRPLTTRQRGVLIDLVAYADNVAEWGDDGFARPMDVGGTDGSYHSAVLSQLVRRGLAEKRQRGGWCRVPCRYRATQAGRDMSEKIREGQRTAHPATGAGEEEG